MEYPILYPENETLFENYGLFICNEAYDLQINEVLNGEYSISFKVPTNRTLLDLINPATGTYQDIGWIKCQNTIFSVDKISIYNQDSSKSYLEIQGQHIKFWLRQNYVNYERYSAETPDNILIDLINKYVAGRNLEAIFYNRPASLDVFTINNFGTTIAKPIIQFTGFEYVDLATAKTIKIKIGTDELTYTLDSSLNINGSLFIDFNTETAYIKNTPTSSPINKTANVSGNWGELVIGNNSIVFSGGFSNINIIKVNYLATIGGRFLPSAGVFNNGIYDIEFRNKNVYECLTELAEKCGAEIQCSNMPIAGKFDIRLDSKLYYLNGSGYIGGLGLNKPEIHFRKNKNIVSIKKEIDYNNVINKLYVFGKGGGSFDNHTIKYDKYADPLDPSDYIAIPAGQNFIRGPLLNEEKIGYINFPDIANKTELYWAGWTKFVELSNPRVNYDIEIVDLQYLEVLINFDQIEIGDRVTYFEDNENGTETAVTLRVTEYTRYPLEPEKNSVRFSTVENSIFYSFNDFWKTKVTMDRIKDSTGTKIMPDNLAGVVVSKDEIITEPGNPAYGGHVVAGATRSGLRVSPTEDYDANALFLELNGKTWLLNKGGVGIYIPEQLLGNPQLRTYNGTTYVLADIVTENNINAILEANSTINRLKDVAYTVTPQVGMTLKWNGTNWVPSF